MIIPRSVSANRAVFILAALVVFAGLGFPAHAEEDVTSSEFLAELRNPMALIQRADPGISETKSLSAENRADLLAAKQAMVAF